MQEPDGLWEALSRDLKAGIPVSGQGTGTPGQQRFIPLWLKSISVATASAAAIALIVWLSVGNTTLPDPVMPTIADHGTDNSTTTAPTDISDRPLSRQRPDDLPVPHCPATIQNRGTESEQTAETTRPTEQVNVGETPDCTTDEQHNRTTDRRDNTVRRNEDYTYREYSGGKPLPINTRHDSRLTLSVFTSGALGSGAGNTGHIDRFASLRSMVADDGIYTDQPLLVKSRSVNSFNTRQFDMRHHLPLRVGVKFSYLLWNNIAIETGVQYSRHTSDFSYSGDLSSAEGEQELHYIGIPLDVHVGLARWKRIRTYAVAGVSAEKLIKGRLKGQVTDIKDNITTRRESLHEKPLQWTLRAAAGLQYDMTGHLGLYIEPGLGYHPDNNSSIRNIYKDRPLDFTLTIGLRVSLPR